MSGQFAHVRLATLTISLLAAVHSFFGGSRPASAACAPPSDFPVTVTKNSSGTISVGWTQQANMVHDVIRGTYTALQQGQIPSGAACRSSNTTATAYSESAASCGSPQGCWYVVRAQTLCGNGTWGSPFLDSHLGGVCPAGCAPVANCNDNNTCTTGDSCGANDVCQYTPVTCNDSNACTNDRCINQLGCFHTPVNCNDNNLCTSDVCFQTIGCVHVLTICDDGNPCTNDSCDPQTGDCEHNRPFMAAGGGSLRAEEAPEDASRSDTDGPGGPAPVKAERPWSYDDLDSLPTIDFLSSDDGPVGAYVAIFGNDFGARTGAVTFGGAAAMVASWTERKIIAVVPEEASGPIRVTTSGRASAERGFQTRPGRVRHVDGSARTGGDGTSSRPWSTFAAADAGVTAGDFVLVHGGTYSAASGAEAILAASASGEEGRTVTWFADPDASVFLDASTATKQAIRVHGDFVHVVGFVTAGARYQGVYLAGADDAVIDCEVKDGSSSANIGHGVLLHGARARALGNHIHDSPSHGIYANADGMEIAYNFIARSGKGATDTRGYGIHAYAISPGPSFTGARIYRNVIVENNRSGLTIASYAIDAEVSENVIAGNDESCGQIGYNAQNTSFHDNVCYGNTIDRSGIAYEIDLDGSRGARGAVVQGNVVVGSHPLRVDPEFATSASIDGNLYVAAGPWSWGETLFRSLEAWRAASGKDAASSTGPHELNGEGSSRDGIERRAGAGRSLLDPAAFESINRYARGFRIAPAPAAPAPRASRSSDARRIDPVP